MKRKLWKWIILIVLLVILLVPQVVGVDDGGTWMYITPLYTVEKAHSLADEGGQRGYLVGTRIRLLFFEVFDNVRFVPSE